MIKLVWIDANHSLTVKFTFCLGSFPHSTTDKETGRHTVGTGWAHVYEGRQWTVLFSVSLITRQPIHFIVCLSADLWQGVTIIRFIGGDVWEWKGTCYRPHPARVNKTKKSNAPKDLWGEKKKGKGSLRYCWAPSLLLPLKTSASNCEAEHTAVTLRLDTDSLIYPFIRHRHVISILLPREQPERQEMKSMPCLCAGCYFISMGTTDVAVNLIYEKGRQPEHPRQREGFITADDRDKQSPMFHHSFANIWQRARTGLTRLALTYSLFSPAFRSRVVLYEMLLGSDFVSL